MENERLLRQFERNKERFAETKKGIASRSWRAVFGAAAISAVSVAGTVFYEPLLSTAKSWTVPTISQTLCHLKDRVPLATKSSKAMTVVVLPIERDDAEETTRNNLTDSFRSNFSARTIQPCESFKISYSGYADDVTSTAHKSMEAIFNRYDADLIVWGAVQNEYVRLKVATRHDDPFQQPLLYDKSDLKAVAFNYRSLMLYAADSLLGRTGCLGKSWALECVHRTGASESLVSAIPKIDKVQQLLELEIEQQLDTARKEALPENDEASPFQDRPPYPPSYESFHRLLLKSLNSTLDRLLVLRESGSAVSEQELVILHDFALTTLKLARDLSIADSEKGFFDIIEGAFDQLLGETCKSLPVLQDSKDLLSSGITSITKPVVIEESAANRTKEKRNQSRNKLANDPGKLPGIKTTARVASSNLAGTLDKARANDLERRREQRAIQRAQKEETQQQLMEMSAELWLAHTNALILSLTSSDSEKTSATKALSETIARVEQSDYEKLLDDLPNKNKALITERFKSEIDLLNRISSQSKTASAEGPKPALFVQPVPVGTLCR